MADHGHVWGLWGDWECCRNGQDMRTRSYLDATCGEVDTQWRRCRH